MNYFLWKRTGTIINDSEDCVTPGYNVVYRHRFNSARHRVEFWVLANHKWVRRDNPMRLPKLPWRKRLRIAWGRWQVLTTLHRRPNS